jgi:hypothetical protein
VPVKSFTKLSYWGRLVSAVEILSDAAFWPADAFSEMVVALSFEHPGTRKIKTVKMNTDARAIKEK